MKKTVSILLALFMLLLLCSCGAKQSGEDKYRYSQFEETDDVTCFVKISVADFGDMIVELIPEIAPITVANFQKLVKEGFYDGLTFHRVYKGFMIQGGDPAGNGTGGSSEKIKGEFAYNGVFNNISHKRGTLSMARSSLGYDTASSQFFIMHVDNTTLDGQYAAFGHLVAGFDVLDSIADVKVMRSSLSGEMTVPVTAVVITSAKFVKLK